MHSKEKLLVLAKICYGKEITAFNFLDRNVCVMHILYTAVPLLQVKYMSHQFDMLDCLLSSWMTFIRKLDDRYFQIHRHKHT